MNWAALTWLVLMVIFLIAEGASVMVISLWFAIGALTAMVASLCGAPVWLQALLFFVVSVSLLLSLRPLTKKYFTPRISRTNVDAVIGKEGLVLEVVDNVNTAGRVKVDGMEWAARSENGQVLQAGERIVVNRVEGVKLFVSPLPVETNAKP